MNFWPLQNAKAHLSEVVKLTVQEGPQGISVRGEEKIVLLTKDMYECLTGQKKSLLELIDSSPLKAVPLVIERDKSLDREIDL